MQVNVFLGLGLPWMIAAVYWSMAATPEAVADWHARYRQETWYYEGMPVGFAVPSADLGFSVGIFSCMAITCLVLLALRRAVLGYELGGPECPKTLSAVFLVGLWLSYIALSAAQSYGVDVPLALW